MVYCNTNRCNANKRSDVQEVPPFGEQVLCTKSRTDPGPGIRPGPSSHRLVLPRYTGHTVREATAQDDLRATRHHG